MLGRFVGEGIVVAGEVEEGVGSRHPNQPGVWQVDVLLGWMVEGWVGEGAGVAEMEDDDIVLVGSLHPNHPCVLHVVVVVDVSSVVVVVDVVVVSSKHPHHPGVLHVSVLVCVVVLVELELVVLPPGSVPLLSKNFHA